MKKSVFKTIAEAIAFNGLKDIKLPTGKIDRRKLTVAEIKKYIVEEFGKVKEASDNDAKEEPNGWGDAELAKQIEWVKTLDLKEFFKKDKK